MSRIFWIVAVTPDQIIKLHETPSLANDLLTAAQAFPQMLTFLRCDRQRSLQIT